MEVYISGRALDNVKLNTIKLNNGFSELDLSGSDNKIFRRKDGEFAARKGQVTVTSGAITIPEEKVVYLLKNGQYSVKSVIADGSEEDLIVYSLTVKDKDETVEIKVKNLNKLAA